MVEDQPADRPQPRDPWRVENDRFNAALKRWIEARRRGDAAAEAEAKAEQEAAMWEMHRLRDLRGPR